MDRPIEFEKCFPVKSGPFRELNEDEFYNIHKNTHEILYKKGESVIKQGTKPSHILFIKKGLLKIIFQKNNREMVISLEGRGKLIGLQALFSSEVYPYSAYCCEDVKACLIDFDTVKSIILKNPPFGSRMISLINEHTFFIYHRMFCLSLNQIQGRFAHLLMFLSHSVYRKKEFITSLTKKDIAQVTNMTQESLSRVIKEFIADNLIEYTDNRIIILNYKKIKLLSIIS